MDCSMFLGKMDCKIKKINKKFTDRPSLFILGDPGDGKQEFF